jgi:asparagine synthase (glutamine-hydrolysing)
MCGIAGFLASENLPFSRVETTIEAMTATIAHRGPDDSGTWIDAQAGVALGHRRLSILDLSPQGHQPMASEDGRYMIVFNGEVYNFGALRKQLEPSGHRFRGGSDTEVVLAAIQEWGLRAAVARFIGMFAFALWDQRERKLFLARDRLGIKPLYYGWADNDFVFGSELKVLTAHPTFDRSINRDALCSFFRFKYVPTPYAIYLRARKLSPGNIAVIDWSPNRRSATDPEQITYWSALEYWQAGVTNPWRGGDEEAVATLESLLQDAVAQRMIADVPLGAFLSGGIDSSLVVALMQARSGRPVKTFTIGFQEQEYNEAPFAREIAAHLGTDHTELYVGPTDLLEVIPKIPKYWDEPFSDSSQIPTFIISELTRQHVTVSLSGDGGDELFAGYRRYIWASHWRYIRTIPLFFRKLVARGIRHFPEKALRRFGAVAPKIRGRADLLASRRFQDFYLYLMSHHKAPQQLVNGGSELLTDFSVPLSDSLGDLFRRMTYLDLVNYLPDDILTKVDRASMAVGLEARVPILDHRVVELAAQLPTSLKVRNNQGKWILRRVLDKYVPRRLYDRPKKGFAVPIDRWLRNELRDWASDLLNGRKLRESGYLNVAAVDAMWAEYLAGRGDWYYYLWDILIFQEWIESQR